MRLSARRLNRTLLARQHLLERTPASGVVELFGDLTRRERAELDEEVERAESLLAS